MDLVLKHVENSYSWEKFKLTVFNTIKPKICSHLDENCNFCTKIRKHLSKKKKPLKLLHGKTPRTHLRQRIDGLMNHRAGPKRKLFLQFHHISSPDLPFLNLCLSAENTFVLSQVKLVIFNGLLFIFNLKAV